MDDPPPGSGTARVLIVEDRTQVLERLRHSIAGYDWLVPIPVTSTDALARALEGGVEMALIRYAFEGGRGLAVLKTIYANDSTTTFNLYTDLRVDPKLLAQMKGKLLDENKLIADKGMFIAVSASRTFSKRADDRKLPKSGRAYSDHRQAEEAFEIRMALRAAGTVMEAAGRLGIAEEELRERMKRHGIDAPS
jgi:DNA-binding NtrC family response regulator